MVGAARRRSSGRAASRGTPWPASSGGDGSQTRRGSGGDDDAREGGAQRLAERCGLRGVKVGEALHQDGRAFAGASGLAGGEFEKEGGVGGALHQAGGLIGRDGLGGIACGEAKSGEAAGIGGGGLVVGRADADEGRRALVLAKAAGRGRRPRRSCPRAGAERRGPGLASSILHASEYRGAIIADAAAMVCRP